MNEYHSLDTIKNIKNPVITVGMLDGIHLGHQTILKEVIRQAKKNNGESVVITFWPHPRSVVSNSPVLLLNTLDEKLAIMQSVGIKHVVVLPFTREFSVFAPDDFICLLFEKLHFKTIILGYDHHFGKNRDGDFKMVSQLAKKINFSAIQVPAFQIDNINVSSTKIRNALFSGKVAQANKFLGYHYSLIGMVIKGEGIGHQLGFPTANLKTPSEKLIPANGVYAVKVTCRTGQQFYGMLNIGKNPTVNINTDKLFIEVHIFDFNREIYGETITILLLEKIRNEKRFSNINELKKQIEKDKETIFKLISH